MKNKLKTNIVTFISYLYIFLFTYTAVSKIIDFETFAVQLGQSPLLSAYANWVAVLIPAAEIIISLLLLVPKIRYIGLFLAFGLMVMFSSYIIIILNYSDFIPCSCGGILSDMNWNEHLIFNFTFVVIGGIGIVLETDLKFTLKKQFFQLTCISLFSMVSVIVLYNLSENEIHRNNAFIRRYPHHPITELKGIPLKYNSYYIAGFDKENIILGNSSAPLHLLIVNTSLKNKEPKQIKILTSKEYPFSSIQIKIKAPYFYIVDGTIPLILRGNIKNWEATEIIKPTMQFSLFEPINENQFIIRQHKTNLIEYDLNILDKSNNYKSIGNKNILKKNIDGIFDTDGILLYNKELNRIIYTYYYRNQFIVADSNLSNKKINKTIDTLQQAPLTFAYIKNNSQKKLAKQPTVVNIYSATSNKYAFIKSNRLGKYESETIAKQASIIDVYDIEKNTYEFSFYFYNYQNEEIKTFKIYKNLIVGLTNNNLVIARLKPNYFKLNQ